MFCPSLWLSSVLYGKAELACPGKGVFFCCRPNRKRHAFLPRVPFAIHVFGGGESDGKWTDWNKGAYQCRDRHTRVCFGVDRSKTSNVNNKEKEDKEDGNTDKTPLGIPGFFAAAWRNHGFLDNDVFSFGMQPFHSCTMQGAGELDLQNPGIRIRPLGLNLNAENFQRIPLLRKFQMNDLLQHFVH